MLQSFVRRTSLMVALSAAALVVAPNAAEAQDDKVYALAELQTAPKLRSTAEAGRHIQESYPEDLKRRGVGGMVEIEFVVDEKGKVVASSINVLDATQSQLGEAAKKVAAKLEFQPGKAGGSAVKCKVVLPIVYKAS
jgi:protein TonB